jgi:hypothetical protein
MADPPRSGLDSQCPFVLTLQIGQFDYSGGLRVAICDSTDLNPKARTLGSAPAMDDALNLISLSLPEKDSRLLGVGMTGIAFHLN